VSPLAKWFPQPLVEVFPFLFTSSVKGQAQSLLVEVYPSFVSDSCIMILHIGRRGSIHIQTESDFSFLFFFSFLFHSPMKDLDSRLKGGFAPPL